MVVARTSLDAPSTPNTDGEAQRSVVAAARDVVVSCGAAFCPAFDDDEHAARTHMRAMTIRPGARVTRTDCPVNMGGR